MIRLARATAYVGLSCLAIAACVLLSGCLTPREEAAARIAVQYATLRVIDGQPGRAARVGAIANEAIEYAEGGEAVDLAVLEQQVRAAIPWEDLHPADAQLVHLLISYVRAELEARVGEGLIPPERVAVAVEVLRWVREASEIAEPRET